MIVIHLNQLGSTTIVGTTKLRYGELGQLLESLATEAATRSQTRREQLDNTKKEQIEFLTKCKSLIQTVIPGPIGPTPTSHWKKHISYLKVWF